MKANLRAVTLALSCLLASVTPLFAQFPGGPQQQPEFIRQGQQLMRDGKMQEALDLYR